MRASACLVLCLVALGVCRSVRAGSLQLDDSSYAAALSKHPFLFVKLYAQWCYHCQMLAEPWEELAGRAQAEGDPFVVASLDAEANPVAGEQAKGFPTLIFYAYACL